MRRLLLTIGLVIILIAPSARASDPAWFDDFALRFGPEAPADSLTEADRTDLIARIDQVIRNAGGAFSHADHTTTTIRRFQPGFFPGATIVIASTPLPDQDKGVRTFAIMHNKSIRLLDDPDLPATLAAVDGRFILSPATAADYIRLRTAIEGESVMVYTVFNLWKFADEAKQSAPAKEELARRITPPRIEQIQDNLRVGASFYRGGKVWYDAYDITPTGAVTKSFTTFVRDIGGSELPSPWISPLQWQPPRVVAPELAAAAKRIDAVLAAQRIHPALLREQGIAYGAIGLAVDMLDEPGLMPLGASPRDMQAPADSPLREVLLSELRARGIKFGDSASPFSLHFRWSRVQSAYGIPDQQERVQVSGDVFEARTECEVLLFRNDGVIRTRASVGDGFAWAANQEPKGKDWTEQDYIEQFRDGVRVALDDMLKQRDPDTWDIIFSAWRTKRDALFNHAKSINPEKWPLGVAMVMDAPLLPVTAPMHARPQQVTIWLDTSDFLSDQLDSKNQVAERYTRMWTDQCGIDPSNPYGVRIVSTHLRTFLTLREGGWDPIVDISRAKIHEDGALVPLPNGAYGFARASFIPVMEMDITINNLLAKYAKRDEMVQRAIDAVKQRMGL